MVKTNAVTLFEETRMEEIMKERPIYTLYPGKVMYEEYNNRSIMATRPWSDLPLELLSIIADRLGLIELLRFRSVCKYWHCASSTASAQPESLTTDPWFLVYGEGSECSLFRAIEKYSINIPEMDGATCLASNGGWLLLYCKGSMFFFCPFSRAKINLPSCPFSEEQLKEQIAAFSSAPTCQDCVVVVINRVDDSKLELDLLHRGKKEWTKHSYLCPRTLLNTITGAVYHDGLFQFVDDLDGLLTFDAKNNEWQNYAILPPPEDNTNSASDYMSFLPSDSHFLVEDMRAELGFEDNVSISTRGMLIAYYCSSDVLIKNESIPAAEGCEKRHLEGVWIQPRYFQISPEHSWLFADGGV